MSRFKKILLVCIVTIIVFIVGIIFFISPITKYLIEKFDEKYTGREITMDWAYVNPFTGYIHFNNLKIYELQSDSIFFSADGISANVAILKLFSKTYEISEFVVDHPYGIISQTKEKLNFNDLLEKFSPKEDADTTEPPVHFNIISIKIADGEFHYKENTIPINYFIKEVNFESTGKRWDADTIAATFSFLPGIGSGDIKGDFTINVKSKDYRLAVLAHKFDLNIIEQYLKDLTNYGSFSANVDADMHIKGNFSDEENIISTGMLAFNDFHFGKNPKEDFAAFDKLIFAIKEVSPKNHKYLFDSVSLTHPYFKYERYDYLDNIETIFGTKGSNITDAKADPARFNLIIEIADYIKVLSKNFFKSYYKINRLAIYKGDLRYIDYSLGEKFSIELNPLVVISDSINKNNKRVNLSFVSAIKPYGNISASFSINPNDNKDFDLYYHFQKIPIALFNPYTIAYTSYPLDRGSIEFKGSWNVKDGMIQSNNHLLIIDPRVAKRVKSKDAKWIPTPLIMTFVRERGNVIDYEIPITGNLKSPTFHLHDVLFDLLKNIFIKPVTIPYGTQVKTIETEIEKSLSLKWAMRSSLLLPSQEKFIEKMSEFLSKNPDASIVVSPKLYSLKEKEHILFFEAKKKYYEKMMHKDISSFNKKELSTMEKMSIKDSSFIRYLNKQTTDPLLFTIQQKCAEIVPSSTVNSAFAELSKKRSDVFMHYFTKNGVGHQVKMVAAENTVPYNGFSFYKITYKGELPNALVKAFKKMDELNDDALRSKFKQERKKNRIR